jgi:hypothetical protein
MSYQSRAEANAWYEHTVREYDMIYDVSQSIEKDLPKLLAMPQTNASFETLQQYADIQDQYQAIEKKIDGINEARPRLIKPGGIAHLMGFLMGSVYGFTIFIIFAAAITVTDEPLRSLCALGALLTPFPVFCIAWIATLIHMRNGRAKRKLKVNTLAFDARYGSTLNELDVQKKQLLDKYLAINPASISPNTYNQILTLRDAGADTFPKAIKALQAYELELARKMAAAYDRVQSATQSKQAAEENYRQTMSQYSSYGSGSSYTSSSSSSDSSTSSSSCNPLDNRGFGASYFFDKSDNTFRTSSGTLMGYLEREGCVSGKFYITNAYNNRIAELDYTRLKSMDGTEIGSLNLDSNDNSRYDLSKLFG